MLRQIFAVAFVLFSISFSTVAAHAMDHFEYRNAPFSIAESSPEASLDVTSVLNVVLNNSLSETPSLGDITQRSDQYTYQFQNYGVVDIITTKVNGDLVYSNMMWDIQESQDGVVISITNPPTGETFTLSVEEIGNDYLVIDFGGQTLKLNARPDAAPEQIINLENELSGLWDASAYPFDIIQDVSECGAFEKINGAYLSYEFNTDGTYTKWVGSKMVAMEEAGVWEISRDGQFVLFHATVDGNPENVYHTQVAHIDAIDGTSLVLSQALSVPESDFDTLFCTTPKEFYLGKVASTTSLK